MVSRSVREAREKVPSFGAPMGTPEVSTEEKRRRERERRSKLETKPTAGERQRLIEEHEERGIEETAGRRRERDRRTRAPKPEPEFETVRKPGGGTPAQILQERPQDVEEAIRRAEGAPPLEKPAPAVETPPERPLRKPPKQKR